MSIQNKRMTDRRMTHDDLTNSLTADSPHPVDVVARQVKEISTLPQVALKVIEVARDPDAGAADLKAVVEGDPALSARVLRIVNSASCGVRSTVTNLHQAISYLGFSQVRNLAMTASVSEIFKKDEQVGSYCRSALWRHLVSVGICARMVASRCRIPDFEDAFLAGLLHDIGINLEDQRVHARFSDMIGSLGEGLSLSASEREWLGFDHCLLGERIAEAWGFPPTVRDAIRFHHSSQLCEGEDADIVCCVEIANVICTLKGITSVGRCLVGPPLDASQALGLQKEDFVILATDLDHEIELNENLFEL